MTRLVRIDSTVATQPLHGVSATRRVETRALEAAAPHALMEQAGAAVARLAIAVAPHAREAWVFAGPGNNGGDGLVAARLLHAAGRAVHVLWLGDEKKLPADAAHALDAARAAGIAWVDEASRLPARRDGASPAIVVDALLGIGASRPPDGRLAEAVRAIAERRALGDIVVSVDVPSGLDADRGQPIGGACVEADHTVTLLTAKPGFFTAAGRDHAGTVWLADLGVGADDGAAAGAADALLVGSGILRHEPRRHGSHKGRFGDVAVVGGAAGMTGAAWLAARAALAAGAGRVFVDTLDADANAAAFDPIRPELMHRPGWWRGPRDAVAAGTVVCGCGGGQAVAAALPTLLSLALRLVLDADALNALAGDTGLAAALAIRARRGQQTVLTPHPLEAARLLGSSAAVVQADRLAAATELARRHRCVVVLKGSGSIVAAPDATSAIVATGNGSLASAGTGDVLAGWLGGRWQPGGDAFAAARQATVEHGAAAEPLRPGALIASELIERLYRRSRRTDAVGDLR